MTVVLTKLSRIYLCMFSPSKGNYTNVSSFTLKKDCHRKRFICKQRTCKRYLLKKCHTYFFLIKTCFCFLYIIFMNAMDNFFICLVSIPQLNTVDVEILISVCKKKKKSSHQKINKQLRKKILTISG